MAMRIIAGKYRHRLLTYPIDNPNIRPTKDRIREAFFSSLGDISGLSFLDLYAGSGSMGIEAISRGASEAYLVDNSPIAIKCIKENVKTLDIDNAHIIFDSDFNALRSFKENNIKFDIIYLDPPYEKGQYEEVISYIYKEGLIKENGILAFEANRNIETNNVPSKKKKEYHYGEIFVTVLRF